MIGSRPLQQDLSEIKALQRQLAERLDEVVDRVDRLHGHRLIAFIHIPKTGGGTVKAMLRAGSAHRVIDCGNFLTGPDRTTKKLAEKLAARGWAEGAVAIGHVQYGTYRAQLPPGVRYMTFLREPVDRVISHYSRHIGNAQGRYDGAKPRFAGADSLEKALTNPDVPDLDNLQTRFLCSDPAPVGRLPDSALDDAKRNLAELAFVGIQEQFTESLVLLERSLGVSLEPATDRHVNAYRPSLDELGDRQRELVEEHTRLDAELYQFARELFEQRVADSGETFSADADALRAETTAVNEAYAAELQAAVDWLERELPPDLNKDARRDAAAKAGISGLLYRRAVRRVERRRGGAAQ
jgi:hypothetical protein